MAKKNSWFSLVRRLFISDPEKVVVFTCYVFFFFLQIKSMFSCMDKIVMLWLATEGKEREMHFWKAKDQKICLYCGSDTTAVEWQNSCDWSRGRAEQACCICSHCLRYKSCSCCSWGCKAYWNASINQWMRKTGRRRLINWN